MTQALNLLAELSDFGPNAIWKAFLVFLRVGAVMALLPVFGEQSVPQRVRLVLALAFTTVVLPAVFPALPDATPALFGPTAIEAGIGLALGFALRLFIHALQIAATIAAQATSLSQLAAGTGPEPQPAIGQFLVIGGLALAAAGGLHVRAAEVLILSYDVLPAGALPAAADLAQWELGRIAAAFALGFSLAVPFVIASVLYNLALGVVNRAMPALMVTMIGAPVQVLGGIALLALGAPTALAIWQGAFAAFLATPFPFAP